MQVRYTGPMEHLQGAMLQCRPHDIGTDFLSVFVPDNLSRDSLFGWVNIPRSHLQLVPEERQPTMENQHRKISGYRDLTQAEIDLMNVIEGLGPVMEEHVAQVLDHLRGQRADCSVEQSRLDRAQPERWAAIARTHFQEGLMALTRAVAQPTFF